MQLGARNAKCLHDGTFGSAARCGGLRGHAARAYAHLYAHVRTLGLVALAGDPVFVAVESSVEVVEPVAAVEVRHRHA